MRLTPLRPPGGAGTRPLLLLLLLGPFWLQVVRGRGRGDDAQARAQLIQVVLVCHTCQTRKHTCVRQASSVSDMVVGAWKVNGAAPRRG